MKKKVGILIPSINEGGAERVVSRLTYILNEKYDLHVIVYEDTYLKYPINVPIINLNLKANTSSVLLKLLTFFKRIILMKKTKRKYKFDAVISFMDSPNVINILSSDKKCKTIISIRNYNFSRRNKLINSIIFKLYKKSDQIISVSKKIEEDLVHTYKIDENKITTIYNPYDNDEIEKLKKVQLQEKYNLVLNNNFNFVSVGRNTYQKGFWHLIKAFKIVNDIHPGTKLVIVGRDETQGKASKLISELGLKDNVLLVGSQKNPFNFVAASDVYVTSSLFEGFPNSMVEAMVCGKPIISTDCNSGPREILSDTIKSDLKFDTYKKAEYGILAPAFNFDEIWDSRYFTKEEKILADAMLNFIQNPSELELYKEKAKKRAEKFSSEECGLGYIDLIDKVLK
ncbi:glycosyltransferase [Exiguobacterium alkaliphilum]|uniref:glycosyltransferase n=1 Tax=Exiguobacterium alkaliphilum TaxID=1428684 RepID=UPI001BA5C38A|nr:glycosyltransferase [Exiguobacterium alkaliphilum]QUE87198.1 glycosyltransferase [Exiguobacterium alkaliphilum]